MPLKGQADIIRSLVFDPLDNGQTLFTGSFDHTILTWDMSGGNMLGQPVPGQPGSIESITISPDGKRLASSDDTGVILLWDFAATPSIGRPLSEQGYGSIELSLAFSPDGRTVASGGLGNTVRLWDVTSSQAVGQPLSAQNGHVTQVTFSRDGKTLVVIGQDGSRNVWDWETGEFTSHPFVAQSGNASTVVLSPDGTLLASAGCADQSELCTQGKILISNLSTGQDIGLPLHFPIAKYAGELAFSPDGKILASASCSKLNILQYSGMCIQSEIRLWDTASGQLIGQPLETNPGQVNALAFSPDGSLLASGGYDGVFVWSVSGAQLKYQPINTSTESLAFSSKGFKRRIRCINCRRPGIA